MSSLTAPTANPTTTGLSLASLLASGGLSALLPFLGGLFQGGDPRAKLLREMMQLLSPESINAFTNKIYQGYLTSPAAGANAALAANAGNAAALSAATNSAGAGATSGANLLARAAAAGLGASTLAKVNSDQYAASRQQALQALISSVSGMGAVGPAPNYAAQFGAAGLNFFGPLLAEYMKTRTQKPKATYTLNEGGGGGTRYDPLTGKWRPM